MFSGADNENAPPSFCFQETSHQRRRRLRPLRHRRRMFNIAVNNSTSGQFEEMDLNQIPEARVVMIQTYGLLSLCAAVLSFILRRNSGSRRSEDPFWVLSMAFGFVSSSMTSVTDMSFYYRCTLIVVSMGLVDGIKASIFTNYSPLFSTEMYVAMFCFFLYVIAYTNYMVKRIVAGDANCVRHAICFFTHFHCVSLHFLRMLNYRHINQM